MKSNVVMLGQLIRLTRWQIPRSDITFGELKDVKSNQHLCQLINAYNY